MGQRKHPDLQDRLRQGRKAQIRHSLGTDHAGQPLQEYLHEGHAYSQRASGHQRIRRRLPGGFDLQFGGMDADVVPVAHQLQLRQPVLLHGDVPCRRLFEVRQEQPLGLLPVGLRRMEHLQREVPQSEQGRLQPKTQGQLGTDGQQPRFGIRIPDADVRHGGIGVPVRQQQHHGQHHRQSGQPEPQMGNHHAVGCGSRSGPVPQPAYDRRGLVPQDYLRPAAVRRHPTLVGLLHQHDEYR